MRRYQVFLGAPTAKELREAVNVDDERTSFKWQTLASDFPDAQTVDQQPDIYNLPPATLNAASRRISMIYENIIFKDVKDLEEHSDPDLSEDADHVREQDTMITWPPTLAQPEITGIHPADRLEITFLRPSGSFSRSRVRSQRETQRTEDTTSFSHYSANDSSDASVARFPAFQFSLNSLSSLTSLQSPVGAADTSAPNGNPPPHSKRKANLLVAVLEVEGPDTIRIKKGFEAGKEVSLLKIIVGDNESRVCKLTAWREVAERWGGTLPHCTALKRGDVVYLENVLASTEVPGSAWQPIVTLSASPALQSSVSICYRTMPRAPNPSAEINDERFRPDLRLGFSDAAVRKVAAIVRWFEGMAGLPYSG